MGYAQYPPLVEKYKVPIVVTGFEPVDVLEGIRRVVIQLENGEYKVENAYKRVVNLDGNIPAQTMLEEVFKTTNSAWRGIGIIPESGWRLNEKYDDFNAETKFNVTGINTVESPLCRSGEVLQGMIKPHECECFGNVCTPRKPLGATMVSSEGACAAYYNYGRLAKNAERSA